MKYPSTFLAIILFLSVTACDKHKQSDELWIDVRTEEEWNSGHLPEAILIPHTEIAERIVEITTDKDTPIHLYCRSGGRSEQAAATLEALGYTQVVNEGGYEDIAARRAAAE